MARSPLTETYKRVQGMVFYVQGNLSEDEYLLFLDMVAPEPEPEAPAKQTRKKRTRSVRQQSLSTAITTSREAKAESGANGASDALCTAQVPTLGVPCNSKEDYPIHDPKMGYAGYHPFDSAAPAAPVVVKKSGRKKEAEKFTPSIESETGTVIGAGA